MDQRTKNDMQETEESMFVMGTNRIEALSDGVFAISNSETTDRESTMEFGIRWFF